MSALPFHPNSIRSMEDITMGEKIGNGGQAEVFKAKYKLDDIVVKMSLTSDHEDWRRELELARQVRNKHIVQFYHVGQDILVMEYLESGSLSDAILRGSIEDWEVKTRIAKQVSLGLTYLHSQNILHCDIKSANILLTKHMDAKICDFGRARMVGQSGGDGRSPWMAPELFLEPPQYSCKSDVYALGMVMWEMASGCIQPYQGHSQESMIQSIKNGVTEDIPSKTPEAYAAYIRACWHRNPEERPATTEMFRDIGNVQEQEEKMDEKPQFPSMDAKKNEAKLYRGTGDLYYYGAGVRKNYTKAMKYFLKAHDAGESAATSNIGEMYHMGLGVERDYTKAMEWYLKASDTGHSTAKFNIGGMYLSGSGVVQDYTKAMEWYLEASDAGHSGAKVNIGELYRNGYGTEQDYIKAMEWNLKASDAGSSTAKFNIGEMYRDGQGVEQNYAKAMEWYVKASNSGIAEADLEIGRMFNEGWGVAKDPSEAVKWYLRAAEKEVAPAFRLLSDAYSEGVAVPKDDHEAEKWASKAAKVA
ncbi:kinase-like domain-containing protein [Dissophora ornata]|nr:kinase-like domain-containing protein [Dissophora ornata]